MIQQLAFDARNLPCIVALLAEAIQFVDDMMQSI
jgi:hypothetical protein